MTLPLSMLATIVALALWDGTDHRVAVNVAMLALSLGLLGWLLAAIATAEEQSR